MWRKKIMCREINYILRLNVYLKKFNFVNDNKYYINIYFWNQF